MLIDARPYDPADAPAVVDVLQAALGWPPDERYLPFFRWKHEESPAGPSAAWVAVADGGRIVAFRAFVPWPLLRGGEPVAAARAVDTAVHPDWQRQGVFSRLTQVALGELAAAGVELVFNTPNRRSLPGYLNHGWQALGRLPVAVRPRRPSSIVAIGRARGRADRWSLPCEVGVPASEALADRAPVDALLASQPVNPAMRTRWSPEFLRWRYGFGPLAYRAVLAGADVGEGMAIVRARRRGAAVELAICEVLVPGGVPASGAALVQQVTRAGDADYALCLRGPDRWPGFLPLPRQGPVLAARLTRGGDPPPLRDWALTLGAVELL